MCCFPPPLSLDELDQFDTECEDLFGHFQHRNLDALVASVRSTLDAFRKRITTSSSGRSSSRVYQTVSVMDESSRPLACFIAELVLSLPNIIIQPSLEEIQNTVNQAVQCVTELGQHIPVWTTPTPPSAQSTPRSGGSHSQGEWHYKKATVKKKHCEVFILVLTVCYIDDNWWILIWHPTLQFSKLPNIIPHQTLPLYISLLTP